MRESLYWLRVLQRCDLAPADTLAPLIAEANELTAMLTAGMKRIRASSFASSVLLVFVLFVLSSCFLSSQF